MATPLPPPVSYAGGWAPGPPPAKSGPGTTQDTHCTCLAVVPLRHLPNYICTKTIFHKSECHRLPTVYLCQESLVVFFARDVRYLSQVNGLLRCDFFRVLVYPLQSWNIASTRTYRSSRPSSSSSSSSSKITSYCSKCLPSAESHVRWSYLIWHNFVNVRDNWLKICCLA